MNSNRLILSLVLTTAAAHGQSHGRTHGRLAQRTATVATAPAHPVASPAPATNPPASSPAPAGATGALTANQVVQNIQDFYDRTNDFEADFRQTSRSRLSGTVQNQSGHVRFRKPGRMRWDYTVPPGNIVVSDGTTLWAYDAAAHQAIQTNLQQSQLPSALSFLTGTGRLANDFTFRLLEVPAGWHGFVLELRPITPNPSFERIVFYVEGGHFQVTSTIVIDAQGNTNRFDFLTPRVNLNPAQTVFQWSPPAGTQVVRP